MIINMKKNKKTDGKDDNSNKTENQEKDEGDAQTPWQE